MSEHVEQFINRWQGKTGSERANGASFLIDLCALLGVPTPDPASADNRDNAYVFERRVLRQYGDGSETNNYIDLYRRGAFICETKRIQASGKGFDDAMQRARNQAENYARALPVHEGRPPFLLIVDVPHTIEIYAEFSMSGATYTPYPDPRSYRYSLHDLRDETVRETLRAIWLEPLSLDPTKRSAKVTREIAVKLAEIAKSLESSSVSSEKVSPERIAHFLSRCLFCFFAEDVELLPKRSFTTLLEELQHTPAEFVPAVQDLWDKMRTGGYCGVLRKSVLCFGGQLFSDTEVLALNRDQIGLLLTAAQADWQHVEPAIFGTLLERALDSKERHSLGAHYTPRAYVERLVLPTVIEPLRDDWQHCQVAAMSLAADGKLMDACAQVRAFHQKLCDIKILDPACGSANFLYVTLEHLKRLEGEVLNQLQTFGDSQSSLDLSGLSVDPHQFLGIELNPRAAAIAELVLWIGYLQWHYRTRGHVNPPEPVLRDFHNIECRDAVLEYDAVEVLRDEHGNAQTRWDGNTFKTSGIPSFSTLNKSKHFLP